MRNVPSLIIGTLVFAAVFSVTKLPPPGSIQEKAIVDGNTSVATNPEGVQEGNPQHAGPLVPAPSGKPVGKADMVTVDKSDRRLRLWRSGNMIAIYPIALGDAPAGHKQREGDERTPEGRYVIDWRNPKSGYFLSLHISYPNAADKARAAADGVDPGGMIMIHGQPNGYEVAGAALQRFDWTDGCIAVTNEEMQEIWDAVPDGTPIEITP